jgi:bifunctional UDP-N-acetylglucosamine pyrophosphorylase / glucosamine-1-phosphate N-acetyltransferase
MNNQNIAVIILAGGKGTRMESEIPKVLHEIGGKPMIQYTLNNLSQLNLGQIVIVVGYGGDQVQNKLGNQWTYAMQFEPNGNADAVSAGLPKVDLKFETILVLNGDDSGFYKPETLEKFLASHMESGNVITSITINKPQSERLGRVKRDEQGNFEKTLEVWEYEKADFITDEVLCGAHVFNAEWLRKNIGKIDNNNDKKEYRITEALNLAHDQGEKVGLFKLVDPNEWVGINTMEDLQKANELINVK